MTKKQKIMIGVVILIVGGYFLYSSVIRGNIPDSNNFTSTTTSNNGNSIEQTDDYTLEKVYDGPINNTIVAPDLNRQIVFASTVSLDENTKRIVTEKAAYLQAELGEDPQNLSNWLSLGLYQKMAGDYVGASLSWKYVRDASTGDYVSRGNLGNLYAYYIKDSVQAESYYKEAIKFAPTESYLYIQLAEVYRDVFNDLNKARAIIDTGLKNIPNNQTLLQFKASLN